MFSSPPEQVLLIQCGVKQKLLSPLHTHPPKSKCQGIPFRMFTIMFVGFVTQLSVNGITAAAPRGPLEYIDIQSEQTG